MRNRTERTACGLVRDSFALITHALVILLDTDNSDVRESEWGEGGGGGARVGYRLKFHYFVGCQLKCSTFVGCREISVNFLSLVGNFFLVLSVVSNIFSPFVASRLTLFTPSCTVRSSKPYSYSRYWPVTSLQPRLMRGVLTMTFLRMGLHYKLWRTTFASSSLVRVPFESHSSSSD